MTKQLNSSIEIRYDLATESFKIEAKKKNLGKYYYHILNILITPQHIPTPSQEGWEEKGLNTNESDDGYGAIDVGGEHDDH